MQDIVSKKLSDMYKNYYSDGSVDEKRDLAAIDSVDHIQAVSDMKLGRLVDVGAGNGSVIKELFRRDLASEICALEISQSGVDRIKQQGGSSLKEVQSFDGYRIPYPDKSFDTAICIHVLEHVEHERMLLREIGRVAKDIFLEIPLEGGFRGKINYKYGHINYYTPLSFRALIESSGLEICASKVVTSSSDYEQYLYGRKKGAIRHAMRNLLLRVLGSKASQLATYLNVVHCRRID